MTRADSIRRIRAFLEPHLGGNHAADDDDIFALGYVNSLFAMQLVMFVESEFSLSLAPEDLDLANFRSVDAVAALVEAKSAVRR